jgi:acyl-CoA hydrolase
VYKRRTGGISAVSVFVVAVPRRIACRERESIQKMAQAERRAVLYRFLFVCQNDRNYDILITYVIKGWYSMDAKHVKDSQTEQTYLIMPKHSNGYGKMFGGTLTAWIDEMAGIVSRRHCQTETATVSIDNLNFKDNVSVGDMVVLIGRITYVGNTSMEIRVDTYKEELNGIRRMINRAYLVMVSVDENYKPQPVPKLILETESERAEWEGALRRKELRLQRRKGGY